MTTTVHIEHDEYWERRGETAVRGSAFEDERFFESGALAERIDAASVEAFRAQVADLDGFFAIVHESGDDVFAAVDRINTCPLFYATEAGDHYLSDDVRWVRDALDEPGFDDLAELELVFSAMVTGPRTIYSHVKQVRAGEVIDVGPDADAWQRSKYYEFLRGESASPFDSGESSSPSTDDLLSELDRVTVDAFERLVRMADGRPIAVSLSGGRDSRLVATMLARLEYPSVIAFAYGRPESGEVTVSEQVADDLGIPWEFVAYDNDRWYDWFHSPERADYYAEAYHSTAAPSLIPWPAVGELVRSGSLPADAVVVTGDSITSTGEDLGDSPLDETADGPATDHVDRLVEAILARFYDGLAASPPPALRQRLTDYVATRLHPGETIPAAFLRFDWQEYQSKYMVKAGEYAFWGLDWWFPLYDAEYVDFWRRVPLEHLADRSLHHTYVEQVYRDVAGTDPPTSPTSRVPARAIRRVAAVIEGTPLETLASRFWRKRLYANHHVAAYGIMPEEQYLSLSTLANHVHAFTTLEAQGYVSLRGSAEDPSPAELRAELGLDSQ